MNWFRRRTKAEEDEGSYDPLMFDSWKWVHMLPDESQLMVYEKGRYLGRLPIYEARTHGVEVMLEAVFSVGVYTVMPQYDGRLHSGHPFTIGTELDRDTRRRLNETYAAFSEHAQSEGVMGWVGLAGQLHTACDAVANDVRLDDSGMSDLVRMCQTLAEALETGADGSQDDSDSPGASEEAGASGNEEGAAQAGDM